ncbi:FUSC family protein [Isobaculum melis]|uniref:Aromatic acid exporter family member 1 n=1 Tax=Isobaculum melis TaxID=142588 RepID=A0A1H9SQ92_9LACT|nr:FUSC family protein [Isobaculum melis]SER87180.1 Aromatic acid exporter family member 1 [Isobaculum melis]
MQFGQFRIGMRTFKTGVAVASCILIFALLGRGTPMIACLSAVFALRTDLEKTVQFGKNRTLGNTIGGIVALLYTLISRNLGDSLLLQVVGVPIAIILLIVICDGLNYNDGIIGAVSCCLIIIFTISSDQSIIYVVERVVDTFIGSFIAICVNYLIPTPEADKVVEIKKAEEKKK